MRQLGVARVIDRRAGPVTLRRATARDPDAAYDSNGRLIPPTLTDSTIQAFVRDADAEELFELSGSYKQQGIVVLTRSELFVVDEQESDRVMPLGQQPGAGTWFRVARVRSWEEVAGFFRATALAEVVTPGGV